MTQPQPPLLTPLAHLQPPPQQTPPPSPSGSGEPVVNPTPESRLDQLAAEYALIKPQADAKKERLTEITDAIKAELAQLLPEGRTSILLTSPHLNEPLRMEQVTSTRLDSKAVRAAIDLPTFQRWSKTSQSWRLSAVK